MFDFELTAVDREIVDLAHQQALVYRTYARRFDQDQTNRLDLKRVSEEGGFPHVHNIARNKIYIRKAS